MALNPTPKQRKLLKTLQTSSTLGEAMIAAGYSENSAKNPAIIMGTPSWQALIEKYLPDDILLKVQLEGLAATKVITSGSEPNVEVPDYAVRHKYLETGLKVKKHLDNDDKGDTTNIMIVRLDV